MKKAKLYLSLSLIVLFGITKAQDTIYKTNGDILISKILEITPSEIKYLRFNNMNGPTYLELKRDVAKVKFSNGTEEVFKLEPQSETDDYVDIKRPNNKIDFYRGKYTYKDKTYSETKIQKILLETKDNKIITLVMEAKKAKGMQYIGFAAIPLGIAGAISGLLAIVAYGYTDVSSYAVAGVVCTLGSIAAPIVSGSFKAKRSRCNREAVQLFNEKY